MVWIARRFAYSTRSDQWSFPQFSITQRGDRRSTQTQHLSKFNQFLIIQQMIALLKEWDWCSKNVDYIWQKEWETNWIIVDLLKWMVLLKYQIVFWVLLFLHAMQLIVHFSYKKHLIFKYFEISIITLVLLVDSPLHELADLPSWSSPK